MLWFSLTAVNTIPLSISDSFPVEFSEPKSKHKGMTILATIYAVLCLNSAGFILRTFRVADWTPADVTSIIGACSALFAAFVAGYIAIINARTKAKIDEHKALTEKNSQKLGQLENEMVKNTAATEQAKCEMVASVDQAKVRVEELTKTVEDSQK